MSMTPGKVAKLTLEEIDALTPKEIYEITSDDNLLSLLSEELLTALQGHVTVLKNGIRYPSD